jgi:raffinose/stachyose/melibiose transport system substrate-binding protein
MRRFLLVTLILTSAVFAFARGGQEDEIILRIGGAGNGPAVEAIFQDNMAQFEAENPGVTVQWDSSSGDDYQFAGLPSLLQSDTPPDIFFEWGGNRVRNHYLDGYAMEISDLAAEFRDDFSSSAWAGFEYDGGVYGLPLNQDITIQMWYDAAVFEELGLSEPETWDDFLRALSVIKRSGRAPIVMGNADAWVAGNFVGLMLYRMAGNEKAEAIMGLEPGAGLDDPDFVKALEFAYVAGREGFVNADMNTLGYEESFVRMFDGSSVMMPLGSWFPGEMGLVGMEYSETTLDYFMLPPVPGGKGDQTSVLGLNTGYIVNANTEHKDLAYDFLRLMYSAENQARHSEESGTMVTRPSANAMGEPVVDKMIASLDESGSIVAPPDTGYDLEMAFALYEAIARVFEGTATPQEALAEAEAKIAHLRK